MIKVNTSQNIYETDFDGKIKEWQWLETGISVSTEDVLQQFNNS